MRVRRWLGDSPLAPARPVAFPSRPRREGAFAPRAGSPPTSLDAAMALRITNTLTGKKEEFAPLDPEGRRVSWYACGPTVYGPIHIGNARTFTLTDTARRWMEHKGYEVRFVQNITDVDDKIIARANEEGIPPAEVARKYEALFLEHVAALGIKPPTVLIRATEYIAEMVAFVERLMAREHAYASADGSAWFAVRSFPGYGKLSRRNLDDLVQGERVDAEQQKLKRDPLDFSLWKAAKPGEPSWPSPWGEGRPGWHLECSCMALGAHQTDTIDIHSGGSDLVFPHHENEIAQSEAATGAPFARYWMHMGMLNIDGDKMSKSLGNFKYIDQLLERYDALTLRHFLISAHYRTELSFTEANLELARKSSRRYADAHREALKALGAAPSADAWQADEEARAFNDRFAAGMDDDFNTAQAFAALFDLVTRLNTERAAVAKGEGDAEKLAAFASLLAQFREVLGVVPDLEAKEEGLGGGAEEDLLRLLVDVRAEARKARQWALADMVRDRLGELGIQLVDTPAGTEWKRG